MHLPVFPKPPAKPCIGDSLKICDFHEDCPAGEDEAQCGEYHLYKYVCMLSVCVYKCTHVHLNHTLRVYVNVVYTGDFSYEMGSSGWTDTSIGSQAWELEEYNDTFIQGKNKCLA